MHKICDKSLKKEREGNTGKGHKAAIYKRKNTSGICKCVPRN